MLLRRMLFTEEETIHFRAPFDDLIPSDSFDLYWTMWNTNQSTFRGRHLLVLESLFIHHPHATVIMLSSTLNDTKIFLPFRQRGYKIYSFNISLHHMVEWKWYLSERSRDFLTNWDSSSTYFYSHASDYMRTMTLYIYGGTYMDMDALILQPLPYQEFIGYDRSGADDSCTWCVKNSSGLYLAPGFMRFRANRKVLRQILKRTFDRRVYNASCFNCVGPRAFTENIIQHLDAKDPELINLKLLEPHRLYPFMWLDTLSIFHNAEQDTPLQLADLMKRSYSLHFFGHMSNQFSIVRGSLIDLLFNRFDLGDLRPKIANRDQLNNNVRLIHLPLYIYIPLKQGRFIGRDVIYFRSNKKLTEENVRWNITIHVSNGTILYAEQTSSSNLTQAQINIILNEMSYEPFESTSIDTLIINLKSENVSVNCSLTILVFSQWVTILTKTMGTTDRWYVVQRLAASIHKYFPDTNIRIASDSGESIDKTTFLNFTLSDTMMSRSLIKSLFIHDMPYDSGLSICRNYLVNITSTPFFFLLDDDFVLEEDSHLDLLLELIYTYQHIDILAGKIPEDIDAFNDYSGVYLRYNQTLELLHSVPDDRNEQALFPRSSNDSYDLNKTNPCRQVDFVPNVFMGRTKFIRSFTWYEDYKLGEHEDFFIRFGLANRTVYTCGYIQVHHRQQIWWKKVQSPYYAKRARVYKYYQKMLKKHNLKRIITFGTTNLDLDNLPES